MCIVYLLNMDVCRVFQGGQRFYEFGQAAFNEATIGGAINKKNHIVKTNIYSALEHIYL